MKTKFTISIWTWVFLTAAILAGYAQEAILAIIALLGHEFAHVAAALSHGRKIASLQIYPFGGVVRGTDPLALFSSEEITIAFAGPAWNLFCTALGWLLAVKFPLWQQELMLWWQINLWLALINLLPLFPLDGGRIAASVLFKFFGYRRGIVIASYTTQVIAVIAAAYWFLFRYSLEELHYILITVVIFIAAMRERQAAPFVLLRYLIKKNNQFNLKRLMEAKLYAVQEETRLGEIVTQMNEDCYYILCGIAKNGKKRLVGEKAVIDALIEKGGKVRLQDIVEKDFSV